jgi:hypothetical protein
MILSHKSQLNVVLIILRFSIKFIIFSHLIITMLERKYTWVG